MALYSLNFYIPPLVSLSPVSLTKSRCSGVLVNLPNLSLLLHTHSPNLSSSCFRKPIPAKISIELLRATAQQKYVYPDPIPEFAEAETQKFRDQLLKKLLKDKATFGDDLHTVVDVCVEIFRDFLHKEYGGPGTLLVEPFTDMLVALREKKLPGAPVAARAAILWAQNYVDKDWELWNCKPPK